jgi:hypothetical protein
MPLSPLNPKRPPSLDPDSRASDRIAALERRLRTLEGVQSGGSTQNSSPLVTALPTAGRKGRTVILSSDGKLYRDSGSAWVAIG